MSSFGHTSIDPELLPELLEEINRFRRNGQTLPGKRALAWIRVLGVSVPEGSYEDPNRTLDVLMGEPARKLFSYGTLQPGRENAHVLGEIRGDWQPARSRGRRWTMGGHFPAMSWDPDGEPVRGSLFVSGEIDWERLDRFEGRLYRRILLTVRTEEGACHVANAYEAA